MLNLRFMASCMESKKELDYAEFRVLGLLVRWMENLEKVKKEEAVSMWTHVLQFDGKCSTLAYYEELVVYLNYVGLDLQKIIKRNVGDMHKNTNQNSTSFVHLQSDDLLTFLNACLPRIYYNIIFPG